MEKYGSSFIKLFSTKAPKYSVNYDMSVNTPKIDEMESSSLSNLTNFKGLRKVLKKFKNGKAAGIERVSNEMIKASFDILKPAYLKLFNLIITVGQVPAIWCKGLITPVLKNGDLFDPDNYRPIRVLSCLCKFFTNLLISRLYDTLMKEKIINPVQIGFVENHTTTDHIFTLKTIISKHVSATRQGKIYACFVDFKKAYDTAWHEGLFTKLSEVNINPIRPGLVSHSPGRGGGGGLRGPDTKNQS